MRRLAPLVCLLTFAASSGQAQTPKKSNLPPGVELTADVPYVGDKHERHTLDLYLPKSDRPTPLIIWIHGGAWQGWSKANPPLVGLTAKGFAVASINYRLSQHAVYPAQIHDCKAAVRFLRANAKKYNFDPENFGVGGASAGGHLAALVGTTGGIKELEGTLGDHAGVSSKVQAVFNLFGPTDLSKFPTDDPKSALAQLFGGPMKDKLDLVKSANPIEFIARDAPPFLIVHGEADTLVPIAQNEMLHSALQKAGVSSTFVRIGGAVHGGPAFQAPDIVGLIDGFFRKTLVN